MNDEVSESSRPILEAELDEIETLPSTDPDAAVARAREVERRADQMGWTDLQLRAQLVEAEVLCRSGRVSMAGRTAREINRWAADAGDRRLLARSHRVLCLFFSYIGDATNSLEQAVRAMELLDEDVSPRLQVDHLLALSTALAESGAVADAMERLETAMHVADAFGDPVLRVAVLNTQSWVATDALDHDRALVVAQRMASLAEAHGVVLRAEERETLARCQYHAGLFDEGLATIRPVFEGEAPAREGNAIAYCLLTRALLERGKGDGEAARASLEQCSDVCEQRNLASIRIQVSEQLADLYAWEGRYQEAYEQLRRFHADFEALVATEGASRAQAIWAVFATTEARRDSARFQQMAFRDPLTGLFNRRYIDDEFPVLVRQVEDGRPITVGIVDLDHFKQVNDNFSHQVGDVVLQGVATALAVELGEEMVVGRLGGEEFLLVLPGVGPDHALERLERLRATIGTSQWAHELSGRSVTISIGAASTASAATSPADLLARADHNLYRAKRAGRDRVVADTVLLEQLGLASARG